TRQTRVGSVPAASAVDAFCSLDNGLCHAIVLQKDGTITDLVYNRDGTPGYQRVIASVPGARDLTAFWSELDDLKNVIIVAPNGDIWHFTQHGCAPWERALQRNVADALRVAGYDEHHHGIVLTSTGEITDQPFHTLHPAVQQEFLAD